ncbi:MAG: hypothetical protein RLZ12_769 [Bacillota bacterium]|jgi:hypothetical protein
MAFVVYAREETVPLLKGRFFLCYNRKNRYIVGDHMVSRLFFFLIVAAGLGTVVFIGIRMLFKILPRACTLRTKAYHVVIITLNSQQRIEWMVWSRKFWNQYSDSAGQITCLDLGSTDDTLLILERLRYKAPQLRVVSLEQVVKIEEAIEKWLEREYQNKDRLIVLDLRESSNSIEQQTELA